MTFPGNWVRVLIEGICCNSWLEPAKNICPFTHAHRSSAAPQHRSTAAGKGEGRARWRLPLLELYVHPVVRDTKTQAHKRAHCARSKEHARGQPDRRLSLAEEVVARKASMLESESWRSSENDRERMAELRVAKYTAGLFDRYVRRRLRRGPATLPATPRVSTPPNHYIRQTDTRHNIYRLLVICPFPATMLMTPGNAGTHREGEVPSRSPLSNTRPAYVPTPPASTLKAMHFPSYLPTYLHHVIQKIRTAFCARCPAVHAAMEA